MKFFAHMRNTSSQRLFISILFILTSFIGLGQKNMYQAARQKQIMQEADAFSQTSDILYKRSLATARKRGIKLVDSIGGKQIVLQQINEIGEPLYLTTFSNTLAGQMTRTNQLYTGGSLGLNLTGNSDSLVGRLAMWDGGNALATHQEFSGRIALQENTSGTDIHGTHVAGTLIAAGVNSAARGMAFGANLKVWDYNNDNTEISAASPNLLISNHSYGYQAGWVYDSTTNKWQWWGNDAINTFEDYKFGYYDSNTQALDRIAFNAPNFLITKSAGNSRSENGPATGAYYLIKNTKDSSVVARAKNDGYDIISTTGNAKNILTVGAVALSLQIPNKSGDVTLSSFTSWGPTDDGRIKPDIVGVGTSMFSTSNASNTAYTSLQGTSMSSPQVAGSLFLLQQLYNRLNKNTFMRSATLKGLALHTALDIGPKGPDYQSGWGLLQMEKAAALIQSNDKNRSIIEASLASGTTNAQSIIASGNGEVNVTLAWTDPEATVLTLNAAALNNRSPRLVNDLDIIIQDAKGKYLPFILDPENPSALANTGDNFRDNIERISIPNTVPGETYTLRLSHKGTLKNSKQDYSLIISGNAGVTYCSATPTNKMRMIQGVKLGTKIGFNTIDTTGTAIQIEQGASENLAFTFRDTSSKRISIGVDWNQDGDFSDADETLADALAINGNTFNQMIIGNIRVPLTNFYKVRVVTSAATTNLCGNYAAGETAEYVLQVTQPSNDVAAINISSPTGLICATNSTTNILVNVKNTGLLAQANIPVNLRIVSSDGSSNVLTGIIPSIAAGKEQEIALMGNANLTAGLRYTFQVTTGLGNDQNTTNNSLTKQIQIENTAAPITSGVNCVGSATVNFTANTENAIWYNSSAIVGAGSTFTGSKSTDYFVSSGDFAGSFGPKTKSEYGGGSYFDNFGPAPIFNVKSPIILEKARVYVGTSGTIIFSIYNRDTGELISSVSKELEATRTQTNKTTVGGQLTDDKNDPGQIVLLNLPFPKAGNYTLTQSCSNGASIFRSNRSLVDTVNAPNNIGYPYSSAVINLTGALFNGAPITSGYYYLYDMQFRSLSCPSTKTKTTFTTNPSPKINIDPSGNIGSCAWETINAKAITSDPVTFQWLLNGAPITGATQANQVINKAGKYEIIASFNGSCPVTSNSLTYTFSSPLPPLVSFSSGTLTSSTGTNPQWYLNGLLVAGATQTTYAPKQTGAYTIKLTDSNGCIATSEAIYISILAAEKENPYPQLIAFPNPTEGLIQVGIPTELSQATYLVQIQDVSGRVVFEKTMLASPDTHVITLDVRNLAAGTYVIRFPMLMNQAGIKFLKYN